MNTKGLQELVLASALSLGIAGCDERKDFLLKEGKMGEYKVKITLEVMPKDDDKYKIEMYDQNGNLKLKIRDIHLSDDNYFLKFDGEEPTSFSSLNHERKKLKK